MHHVSDKTPTNVIACSLGLCGFAVSAIASLSVGAPAAPSIFRALVAMFICHLIGAALGSIGMIAIREHIAAYRSKHPIPDFYEPDFGPEQPVEALQAEKVE